MVQRVSNAKGIEFRFGLPGGISVIEDHLTITDIIEDDGKPRGRGAAVSALPTMRRLANEKSARSDAVS